jgi:hypothetical protein
MNEYMKITAWQYMQNSIKYNLETAKNTLYTTSTKKKARQLTRTKQKNRQQKMTTKMNNNNNNNNNTFHTRTQTLTPVTSITDLKYNTSM